MSKILIAIILLALGLSTYWNFRPNIYIFSFLQITNPTPIEFSPSLLSLFAKNHLADTIWCVAVFLMVLYLKERRYPLLYTYFLLTLPFSSEILQGLNIVKGTFDWIDLIIYSLVMIFIFKKLFYETD